MNEHSFINSRRLPADGRCAINTKGKSNDKYHRILEAAIKVFAEQGFCKATVSAIAREAGVADGTIYLYFKNKDDILIQFFSYKTQQVFDRFRAVVQEADSATEKLKNLIAYHLEVFQRDYNMAVVYQAEARQHNQMVADQFRDMSKMYLDLVGEIVEQGQQEGSMRRDLYLGLAKRFILGAVDNVINNWVLAGGQYDIASMADPLVDLILRGVGASAEAGRAS